MAVLPLLERITMKLVSEWKFKYVCVEHNNKILTLSIPHRDTRSFGVYTGDMTHYAYVKVGFYFFQFDYRIIKPIKILH